MAGAREEKEVEKEEKEAKEGKAKEANVKEAKEASLENATPTTITGRGARGPTANSTTFAADAEASIQSIVAPTAPALRHRVVHQQQNRKLPRSKELVLTWNLNLLQHQLKQNLHRPSLNDGGSRHHCTMTAAKYSTLYHLYRRWQSRRRYNLPLPCRTTAESYTTPFHRYRLRRCNLPLRRLPRLQLSRANLAPA